MMAAPALQPTDTELKAHARRAAFRASIAAKAAALEAKGVRPQERAQAEPPVDPAGLSLPPMKEPWFSIDTVTAIKTLKVREIQIAVCDRYGLTLQELIAERRFRPLVRTRQVAMYLCSALTGKSLPAIGRSFGGKDHTTVLHAIRKVKALIDPDNGTFDAGIAEAVKALRAELEARLY
ncbi:helix-turn-helix domain-containing protein [Bradyrhizobium sp. McL0615]|uniref:helix-turn-helix domain-containing protein n=1 Tax=Bradyrhizobium sp. McL0615 TaxID=3415673 RepID=UPI003CE8454E